MCAQPLRAYFETEHQQRRALDALFDAWGGAWPVSKNLDLYEASQCAFDPSSSEDEAFRNFAKIYVELKSNDWQVFRPSIPADCWPPLQIFETIKLEFLEFSWLGPVNLLNFPKSGTGPHLESCLAKLLGIKPKKDFPIMVVSKFLHFYNPGLFPIYDGKVIWNKVLFGRFKNDFLEFCDREKISRDSATEDTAAWLLYYMRFASKLMSVAHATFMDVFVDWLGKQPGTRIPKRSFDVTMLYATAFEFTVIGASAAS
jgi:hypothetical protein